MIESEMQHQSRPMRSLSGNAEENSFSPAFHLSDADFLKIATLIREVSGIVLGAHKRDLVYGRLGGRMRSLGMSDFAQYWALLQSPGGTAEYQAMINSITTNVTAFFREPHHFEFLSNTILSGMSDRRSQRLRIWSAACSSGEEPYSIAMTLRDSVPGLSNWDARILATDIDSDIIARSIAGRYESDRVEPISAKFRRRFLRSNADGLHEMSDEVRSLITFKQLNLLHDWPMRGPFDAIFCRNVIIYFDNDTKRALFDRFAEMLRPDGWLFLGHSESLFNMTDRFKGVGRTIYQRVA